MLLEKLQYVTLVSRFHTGVSRSLKILLLLEKQQHVTLVSKISCRGFRSLKSHVASKTTACNTSFKDFMQGFSDL